MCDDHLAYKQCVSKSAFEAKLINDFKRDGLAAAPYVEDGAKMTLYYLNDRHVGTWQSGTGWIFKSAYS